MTAETEERPPPRQRIHPDWSAAHWAAIIRKQLSLKIDCAFSTARGTAGHGRMADSRGRGKRYARANKTRRRRRRSGSTAGIVTSLTAGTAKG